MVLACLKRFKTRKYASDAQKASDIILMVAEASFPWAYTTDLEDKQRHQARFEAISFVAVGFLVAFRKNALLCQAVHDALFDRFDMALREQGVGDIAMSHRMKKFAAAFAGRLNRYAGLLNDKNQKDLALAIAANTGYDMQRAEIVADAMATWVENWQKCESFLVWIEQNTKKEQKAS